MENFTDFYQEVESYLNEKFLTQDEKLDTNDILVELKNEKTKEKNIANNLNFCEKNSYQSFNTLLKNTDEIISFFDVLNDKF